MFTSSLPKCNPLCSSFQTILPRSPFPHHPRLNGFRLPVQTIPCIPAAAIQSVPTVSTPKLSDFISHHCLTLTPGSGVASSFILSLTGHEHSSAPHFPPPLPSPKTSCSLVTKFHPTHIFRSSHILSIESATLAHRDISLLISYDSWCQYQTVA